MLKLFLKKLRAPNLNIYGFEFDKYIDGHNCDGIGKDGYCWYITKNFLKINEIYR